MSEVLKLAMVGCGAISQWHLHGIEGSGAAIEIVAAVDPDAERAETVAKRTGAVPFEVLADALAGVEVDAVDIMVPHHLHESLATEALGLGVHVLLEKPMGTDLGVCKRILDAAAVARGEHGTVFMVGENAQYWPEIVTAKKLIDAGAIGEIVTARAATFFPPLPDFYGGEGERPWRLDADVAGGGVAIDTGSHWIRPLRMWLGEIDSVVAATGRPFEEMEGESLVRSLMRSAQGVPVSCDLMISAAPLTFEEPLFRITGTQGEIVVDAAGTVRIFDREAPGGRVEGERGGYFESFAGEFADFAAAVLEGRPLAAGPEQSLGELRTALAIYRSAETGNWEKVWA